VCVCVCECVCVCVCACVRALHVKSNLYCKKQKRECTYRGDDTRGPELVVMLMNALKCTVRFFIAVRVIAVHGELTCGMNQGLQDRSG
jgi:hypothetical protein